MRKYLLIEARGEFEAVSARAFLTSASALRREGAVVEVFLVQNGVLAARKGADSPGLQSILAEGVPVYADAFALRERAFADGSLRAGVTAAALSVIVDRMADGWSVVWH